MNIALLHGFRFLEQERFDLALPRFREALSVEPNNAEAHTMLALSLLAAEGPWASRLAEAKAHAEEAVRLAPDKSYTHSALSTVLSDLFDWEPARSAETPLQGLRALPSISATRALESGREAVRLDSRDPGHHANLAFIHLAFGRWTEALESANAGLALHPAHHDCLRWCEVALYGLERLPEAEGAMKQLLAAHPNSSRAHAAQGFACLQRRERGEARRRFLEALRINPTLHEGHVGLEASEMETKLTDARKVPSLDMWNDRIRDPEQFASNWKLCLLVAMLVLSVWLVQDHYGFGGPLIKLLAWFFH